MCMCMRLLVLAAYRKTDRGFVIDFVCASGPSRRARALPPYLTDRDVYTRSTLISDPSCL